MLLLNEIFMWTNLWKGFDEAVNVSQLSYLNYLLLCYLREVGPIANVLCNCSCKQYWFLGNKPNLWS